MCLFCNKTVGVRKKKKILHTGGTEYLNQSGYLHWYQNGQELTLFCFFWGGPGFSSFCVSKLPSCQVSKGRDLGIDHAISEPMRCLKKLHPLAHTDRHTDGHGHSMTELAQWDQCSENDTPILPPVCFHTHLYTIVSLIFIPWDQKVFYTTTTSAFTTNSVLSELNFTPWR